MAQTPFAAVQTNDHGIAVVRLTDTSRAMEVAVAPPLGNRTYEMVVGGKNFLYFPLDDVSQLEGYRHLNGIPFLAPWANRMPEGFWANGRKYVFNTGLDPIRLDANGIPIHGLLSSTTYWELADLGADETSAFVTSRLLFWKHPELMANWPFAHEYEMTHRLSAGALRITVTVANLSTEPMPIAIGFHPYFQLPGVAITEASATLPVRLHLEMDSRLVPTGSTIPVSFTSPVSLNDHNFDDGFVGLERDAAGHAVFSVAGRGRKIEVTFGPKFQVAVIFAPPGQNYICFEPMSAITNGINLAHEGKYPDLQYVAPGGKWTESFQVRPGISQD